jgi:SAM-dependent methyltransferase
LPGAFTACECDACGLWFLNPQPSPEHVADLYPASYAPHDEPDPRPISADVAAYLADALGYAHLPRSPEHRSWRSRIDRARQRWKACVELVPQWTPGGSVLEIGAASGARLAALRNLGWTDLHGIELVPAAAERARARGAKIACGSVEDMLVTYPDASFDVVIMSMVLEHLANPFDVMAMIATKLRPGGQLLFSTITRDGLDARLYGSYWGGFDFPRHLVFLRDADIAEMIAPHFETLERAHHAAPQDFVRSAEWRRHEGRWVDRLVLAVRDPLLRYRIGLVLAWTGLTCRVSYRCRRA